MLCEAKSHPLTLIRLEEINERILLNGSRQRGLHQEASS